MPLDADLIDRSLSLSEAERADLAHRLLVSLEPTAPESQNEVDAAWETELQRRVDEVDRGDAKMIPWQEAETRIREALKKARRP